MRGIGVIENKHSTDVESPPPASRVCMSIHFQVSRAPISVECLFSMTLLRGAAGHAGEPPEPAAGEPGRGVIENNHSTNVVSPPPPPRVCMRGLLRTSTPPTMYSDLLLLRASVLVCAFTLMARHALMSVRVLVLNDPPACRPRRRPPRTSTVHSAGSERIIYESFIVYTSVMA